MSGSSSSRNKFLIGIVGAVGAGALLAGAGFLTHHFIEEKKKADRMRQQMDRNKISRRSSISSTLQSEMSEYYTVGDSDVAEEFEECISDVEALQKENLAESLLREVDVLMKGDKRERSEAFNELNKHKEKLSNNVEFLWRFAKAHHMEAERFGAQGNLDKKKKLVIEGLEYAKKALMLDESKGDAHKWFAVLTGMETEFLAIKDKIKNGFKFQEHILKAIELIPSDYSLYHLLGRFKFEIANTSWLEKKMAASLFGNLPEVTLDDAIEDCLKAEKLNSKPWKENRFLIAKCYMNNQNHSSAIKWLNSAKKVPALTEEDDVIDREIPLLIDKCQKFV